MTRPVLAFTQGDPAGIGPEILLDLLGRSTAGDSRLAGRFRPLLIAERAALEATAAAIPRLARVLDRLVAVDPPTAEDLGDLPPEAIPLLDPVAESRRVVLGKPGAADAGGALAALDAGVDAVERGVASALVTAPLAKDGIARHVVPGFVGHTDYLAARAGLERYGRDYLMAFLAPDLRVALLSTHVPLATALQRVTPDNIVDALACLDRHLPGTENRVARVARVAVAGVDPHAGEGGLLGTADAELVAPAVERSAFDRLAVSGPESADSLFARARRGEFDWVLALYHDQGLIAVKTAAFGLATNWTVGLPYLRTSVDHGTAFQIAGQGVADSEPLRHVVETTLGLLRG